MAYLTTQLTKWHAPSLNTYALLRLRGFGAKQQKKNPFISKIHSKATKHNHSFFFTLVDLTKTNEVV